MNISQHAAEPSRTALVGWSRDRLIVLLGLVVVSIAAWGYMLYDYLRMQSLPMSQILFTS